MKVCVRASYYAQLERTLLIKKTCYVLCLFKKKLAAVYLVTYVVGWNDFVITLLREFLYVICFNIRCIIWCLAYIFNLRPLKAKLRIIEAFGTFWQFLAIFAFLAELDNSKHFEPYFFLALFGLFRPCGLEKAQRPKWLAFCGISKHFPSNGQIKKNHSTLLMILLRSFDLKRLL